MRVLINGRELNERVKSLGQRENYYFEIISIAKKAIVVTVIGIVAVISFANLFNIDTHFLYYIGQNVVDGFSQIR
jgi:hypothetical protein